MQNNIPRNPSLTLKHIDQIKIRKVRVFARSVKKLKVPEEKNASSEYGGSTTVSQRSSRIGSSQSSGITSNFFHVSSCDPFNNIQEIDENNENDEDSVILQLNELLNNKSKPIETHRPRANKPPIVTLKRRLKEKILPIKPESYLGRAKSHRGVFND